MQLYKTTNYDKFSHISANRQLNSTHLKHLTASIAKINLLSANPIIVTEDFKIIDGQHRFEVARKNNLPLYYVMVDRVHDLQEVHLLNANNRSWSMQDYLNSYIELGLEDYKVLKEFCDMYSLPISLSMNLLCTGEGSDSISSVKRNTLVQDFKEGRFKITKMRQATEMAENLSFIKPYVEGVIWKDRNFLTALKRAIKKVGVQKLLDKIEKHKGKITRQANPKEYLRQLEEVYNYKLQESNRVRFF